MIEYRPHQRRIPAAHIPGTGSASWLLSVLLLLLVTNAAAMETLAIVVPEASPTSAMSRTQVADLFLARHRVHASKLTPLDRENESLRAHFYRETAGMSLNRLRAYWAKRVFTNRGHPPQSVSLTELQRRADAGEPIITYVAADQIPEGMRVVLELPARTTR